MQSYDFVDTISLCMLCSCKSGNVHCWLMILFHFATQPRTTTIHYSIHHPFEIRKVHSHNQSGLKQNRTPDLPQNTDSFRVWGTNNKKNSVLGPIFGQRQVKNFEKNNFSKLKYRQCLQTTIAELIRIPSAEVVSDSYAPCMCMVLSPHSPLFGITSTIYSERE